MEIKTLIDHLKQPIKNKEPRYICLANSIEKVILDNTLKMGQLLPAERVLAQELGIARVTVAQALQLLEKKGLVLRRQGSGTRVLGQLRFSLNNPFHLNQHFERITGDISVRWLEHKTIVSDELMASQFGITAGEKLAYVRRVYSINEIPCVIESIFVPKIFVPSIDSSLDSIEEIYSNGFLEMNCSNYCVKAMNAESRVIQYLQVKPNTPLLQMSCIVSNENKDKIAYVDRLYRGDIYKFEFRLS